MNDSARSRSTASRRDFLRAAAIAPLLAGVRLPLRWLPDGDARTLVVIELAGGNDGLNTLIPIDDARWAKARPSLAVVRDGAHRLIGTHFALHPALAGLARWFERDRAAAVHGVGYVPPDRSHFHSRDVWHTADPGLGRITADTTGWLGRAAEQLAAAGAAVPGASLGSLRVPLCLRSNGIEVPALQRLEDYALLVDAPASGRRDRQDALAELVRDASAEGAPGHDLSRVANTALEQAATLETALSRFRSKAAWPDGALARALQLAARMVVAGFGTRLIHVEHGGYDTHATQAPAHDALLRQLDRALDAFLSELEAHGALDRTLVLCHSEFGRRVAENRSQGTDHGAAAPVFLCGSPGLVPGLHGTAPDLDDLDDGDVKCTTDFRSVYAEACRFVGVDVERVLGASFEPLGLLRERAR